MHRLPLDWGVCHCQELNAPLTVAINEIIHNFLAKLVARESPVKYDLLVSQLSIDMGGLDILYPSHRAAPNFIITMAVAI